MKDAAFSTLLARLDYPDRVVRLISAQQIGKLLCRGDQHQFLELFLDWLNSRELETDVVTGLSALSLSVGSLDIDRLRILQNIKRPSILADILMEKMFHHPTRINTWANCHSGFAPAAFKPPDEFFSSVRQAGQILLSLFQDVETKRGLPMVRQWAWELDALSKKGFKTVFSPGYFFDHGSGNHNGSFEPRATEVIRSSFLRTLSFAVTEFDMPENAARVFASHCIPLFPDLASVEFGVAPDKWGAAEKITQELLTEFLRQCGEGADDLIIAADGRWHSSQYYLAKVSIQGAFVADDDELKIGEVWPKLDLFHSGTPSCGTHGISGFVHDFPDQESLKGASLIPLSFKFCPDFVPRWQIDLLLNHFFRPLPVQGEAIEATCCREGVKFSVSGEEIAKWHFWLHDWEPGYLSALGPRLGTALTIKRHVVDSWAKETGMKIVLYGRAKSWSREEIYGQYQEDEIWSQWKN